MEVGIIIKKNEFRNVKFAIVLFMLLALIGCGTSDDTTNDSTVVNSPSGICNASEAVYLTWTSLGNPGTESMNEGSVDLVIDSDQNPIVAYNNASMMMMGPAAINVKIWSSGTSWTNLGSPGNTRKVIGLALDPADNKPVVIFIDDDNGSYPTVKKWSTGTTWDTIGGGEIVTSPSDYPSIAIGSDSKPVVSFRDGSNSNYPTVYKWNGTAWDSLGELGAFTSYAVTDIKIASDNKPIVAYRDDDSSTTVRVKKWSAGTTWIDYGLASDATTGYYRMGMGDNDIPIVAYYSNNTCKAKQWLSGTTWTDLGECAAYNYRTPDIAVTSSNLPVVLYFGNSNDPNLVKYNGTSWEDVGTNPILGNSTLVDTSRVALDCADNPVVYIRDSDGKGIVYKFH